MSTNDVELFALPPSSPLHDVHNFIPPGMGWIPDLPDPRDYTPEHEQIQSLLAQLRRRPKSTLPSHVDLRRDPDGVYFSPVPDQGVLKCSATYACLSLVEYFDRRALGRTLEPSTLFLYTMARKLRGIRGDSGIDLRTTWKALVRYGVPPAELWPHEPEQYEKEPRDLSLLGFARDYESLRYFRLDGPGNTASDILQSVKSFLANRFPIAFGFPVPRSLTAKAEIPYRPTYDSIRGGQAVVVVGYDDNYRSTTKGALLVRISWGVNWGDVGYGWLPYAYIQRQLARDFWTVIRNDWLDSGELFDPLIRYHGKSVFRPKS